MEDYLPWEEPLTGAWEVCEDSLPGEEGATESMCDELNAVPIPCWREKVENQE